jgi:hypothetical protein
MSWDDTDNEEYYEDEEPEEENEYDEYDNEEEEEVRLPPTPYEVIYDMKPVEEVNGWYIEDEVIIVNSKDEVSKYKKLREKKKLKNIMGTIVFDLQNLDVPGDKNGAKKMR